MQMTPAQSRQLVQEVGARFTSIDARIQRVFQAPERNWPRLLREALPEDQQPANLADFVAVMLLPVFDQAAVVALRSRTQLRLLAQHARLVLYRWDQGDWPEAWTEIDPLTGQPFLYERRADGSYRLASKGLPETGEIELKYQRPGGGTGPEPGEIRP